MIDDNMCGEFLEFEHRDRMIKVMTNGRKTEALSCPERKIEMAGSFLRISLHTTILTGFEHGFEHPAIALYSHRNE